MVSTGVLGAAQQYHYGTFTGLLFTHSIGGIDEILQFHRRIVRGDTSRFVSQQILAILK